MRGHSSAKVSGFVAYALVFLQAAALVAPIQVRITDDKITPPAISARVDEKVRLDIQNAGKRVHNFVLPAFYIFTPNLPPRQRTTVEFTPDKKGVFAFYSDTGGHPEPGLSGSIHVK